MLLFAICIVFVWTCHVSGKSVRSAGIDDVPTYLARRQTGACHVELFKLYQNADEGLPSPGAFIPACTDEGDYAPVQCHGSTGYCWCVESTGKEIEGTQVQYEQPDCDQEQEEDKDRCIKSCKGLPDGDYQSCHGCHVYASCSNGILTDDRPCAPGDLVWDDNLKKCERTSSTCPGNTFLEPSENCERLLETLDDVQSYLEQVLYHVVNETTILDGRLNPLYLHVLRTMTPEQAIYYSLTGVDNVEVRQQIQEQVCKIADSKSIQELIGGPVPQPRNIIPPPSERKALFGYLLLQFRVIKERLYDFTDTIVDSGYPKFPLQVDREAATVTLNKYFDALFELVSNYGKLAEKYAPDELEGISKEIEEQFTMYVKTENQYLEYLLDAQSIEDLLQNYQNPIGGDKYPIELDENMVAALTDVFFDIVKNRDLYYQFFDVFESVITTITEIGILDLPVAGEFRAQKYY